MSLRQYGQRAAGERGMQLVRDVEVEVRVLRSPDETGDGPELRKLGHALSVCSHSVADVGRQRCHRPDAAGRSVELVREQRCEGAGVLRSLEERALFPPEDGGEQPRLRAVSLDEAVESEGSS